MAQEFYDATMAARQERLASTADMQHQREMFCAALAAAPEELILEIGAGNGIQARDIAEVVAPIGRVVGLDASSAILETARVLAPGVEFVRADAANLPFEDGTFDAVVGAQVLCFLPDLARALSESHRVLKPGGRVVFLDTDWGTLVWAGADPELTRRAMEIYITPYANPNIPRQLVPELTNAGFFVEKISSFVVLNRSGGEHTYAGQTLEFAKDILSDSDGFTDAEFLRWSTELSQAEKEGSFLFSLNRYIFTATKV